MSESMGRKIVVQPKRTEANIKAKAPRASQMKVELLVKDRS